MLGKWSSFWRALARQDKANKTLVECDLAVGDQLIGRVDDARDDVVSRIGSLQAAGNFHLLASSTARPLVGH